MLIVCGDIVVLAVGSELVARLPSAALGKAFAIFLVIVAVRMFIGPSRQEKADPGHSVTVQKGTNLIESGGIDERTGN